MWANQYIQISPFKNFDSCKTLNRNCMFWKLSGKDFVKANLLIIISYSDSQIILLTKVTEILSS